MMVSGGLHGDRGISWMSRKACMNVEGFHGCLGKLAWKFRNFLFGLVYCTYVSHWLFLIEWFIYRAVVLRSVPIKDPPFSFLSISFQSKSSSLYSSFSLFLSLHIFSFLFISLPFSSFLFLSLSFSFLLSPFLLHHHPLHLFNQHPSSMVWFVLKFKNECSSNSYIPVPI
jgi:hypothetical protein